MKRILYCIFVTLLCAICLTACGGKSNSSSSNGNTSTSTEETQKQIAFVHNEITLSVGDSIQVEVETSKANVYIAWSTRDPEVATISSKGVITALTEGQTICYAKFGGETAMCLVKVTKKQAAPMLSVSVAFENDQITLYAGEELPLGTVVKLGDSVVDGAEIEYNVDDNVCAHVENGVVIGDAVGSTTIVINASYEGQTASMTLTVNVVAK